MSDGRDEYGWEGSGIVVDLWGIEEKQVEKTEEIESQREREGQFYVLYCKPTAVYNHMHVAPSPYMLSPFNGALPSHPIVPSHPLNLKPCLK